MSASPNDFSQVIEENRRLIAQNKKLRQENQKLTAKLAATKQVKTK